MAQEYYNLQKAAEVLGLSPADVNAMRERHELHAYRDGADWKFKVEEIQNKLAEMIKSKRSEGDADDTGSVETGDSGEMVVKPESLSATIPTPAKRVRGLDVSAHARNFFDSVKTREPAVCNSTVMRHSHVACHAAALSWILKRTLKLDPRKEVFIDDAEANGLRSRPARDSWKV